MKGGFEEGLTHTLPQLPTAQACSQEPLEQ